MLDAILRKGRQLADDPVLRRWLVARVLKRTPPEPAFTAHRPPYLGEARLEQEPPTHDFPAAPAHAPAGPLELRLPGAALTLAPGDEESLFTRELADIETRLGLHRFAWLPLMGDADPAWVAAIWRRWADRHGTPDQSWAWHPYTAAERAINLLTVAQAHGLPEGAAPVLAAHAPAIAAGLEWFGDHHTSNHCLNNGRGLYLLGLGLGLPRAADMGAAILEAEIARVFRPSGVLREASTHYHLLLTRSLASVWLAARRSGRPEATRFETALARALGILSLFAMPGRFPLVGDISPDCPPGHLFGLLPGGDISSGWTGLLRAEDRDALLKLPRGDARSAEGWLRRDFGPWSGLWHAEAEGWSPMPGHGHQDCGAPELHYGSEVIFLDPGRGSYEQAGEADPYVAAGVHGGLIVDGADPYPSNRPYYAASFRAAAAGGTRLEAEADGVRLSHGGYRRRGSGEIRRSWRFAATSVVIEDFVGGKGSHQIRRQLVTAHPTTIADGVAIVTAPSGRRFRVMAEDCEPALAPVTVWTAYGSGTPGSIIRFDDKGRLPWAGRLTVEVL